MTNETKFNLNWTESNLEWGFPPTGHRSNQPTGNVKKKKRICNAHLLLALSKLYSIASINDPNIGRVTLVLLLLKEMDKHMFNFICTPWTCTIWTKAPAHLHITPTGLLCCGNPWSSWCTLFVLMLILEEVCNSAVTKSAEHWRLLRTLLLSTL